MLGFQKSLVDKSLLYVLLVECCFLRVLEQVLKQVFHDAVFDALSIEIPFFLLLIGVAFDWEDLHELLGHF